MTRPNTPLTAEPFMLSPAGKDYLWGGLRLRDDFGKNVPCFPVAETWECSTHPDGPSVVASGAYQGETLAVLLKAHPEFMGEHPRALCETYGIEGLPILIKLIDAKKDLSVQVHPTDEYAHLHEHGQLGKTEMWYVLDAAPNASLVYGFKAAIEKSELRAAILAGTVEKYLQRTPIQSNDVFFIRSGMVHAIGAGALIAEIQESSNLTYRLYDYHRPDKQGKLRPLHIEKALDVADLSRSSQPRQPMRVLRFNNGTAMDLLCRCKYFQVERMLLNTEHYRPMATFQTNSSTFQVLLCIGGCGMVIWEGGMLSFFKGDCIFVPANSAPLRIHGQAHFLKVSC